MSAWEASSGRGFRAGVAGVLSDGFMCDDRRRYIVRESRTWKTCIIIGTCSEMIKTSHVVRACEEELLRMIQEKRSSYDANLRKWLNIPVEVESTDALKEHDSVV